MYSCMSRNDATNRPGQLFRMLPAVFLLIISLLISLPVSAAVKKTTTNDDFAKAAASLIKGRGLLPAGGIASAEQQFRTGRLIVKTKKAGFDFSSYKPLTVIEGSDKVYLVQFTSIKAAVSARQKLAKLSSVVYAEPDQYSGAVESSGNGKVPASEDWTGNGRTPDQGAGNILKSGLSSLSTEAVKLSAAQESWGTALIKAEPYAAYVKEKNPKTVTVAVLDTGIYSHKDLKNRLISGYDFVDNDAKPADMQGHGTHVAGIIRSCTPDNVKLMPVRIFDENGCGCSSIIGIGIRYAVDHGASVINMSLRVNHSEFVDEAVRYAISKNVVVVAASGNDFSKTDNACPAHIKEAIVVGATNRMDARAAFSNYGNALDVAAPGVEIASTSWKGGYTLMSGTSMAAPHVSGVAAMYRLLYPSYSPAKIEKLVRKNTVDLGDPGWDRYYGTGRIALKVPGGAEEKTVAPTEVSIIAFPSDKITVGSTFYLNAQVKPENATQKTLTWTSSSSSVATVSDGVVKCKKKGKTTITVKTANGKKASFRLEVVDEFNCKMPAGTVKLPYSSVPYTRLEAERVAKAMKKGTTPVRFSAGLIKFTATASRIYTFTFDRLEPLIKTEDDKSLSRQVGGALCLSYDSGTALRINVSTQGGKSTMLNIGSSDWARAYASKGSVSIGDALASRYAKVAMKKGQTLYFYIMSPSGEMDGYVPKMVYVKVA